MATLKMFTKNTFFLFLALIIHQINAQESNTCSCDLLINQCDTLCCCDTNCSQDDFKAFNCPETDIKKNENILNACIPKETLYSSNTPYVVKLTASLFCVEYKETILPNDTNKYKLTNDELKQKVENIYPIILESGVKLFDQEREYFTNLDYVWTLDKNNLVSLLKSPKLNDLVPLRYLTNRKIDYRIQLSDDLDPVFKNEISSFENLKIINRPNTLVTCSNCSNCTDFDFYNKCQNLTTITIKCILGSLIEPKCQNIIDKNPNKTIITSYEFLFEYSNPDGILKASLNFEFKEKSEINSNFYVQNFKVVFKPVNENESAILSGNPGYLIGEPLIAGANLSTGFNIPSDRNSRFTIMEPSMKCNSNSRIPVKFGMNSISECFLEVQKWNDLAETCSNLDKEVNEKILGNGFIPDYVASFGNIISFENVDDWVKIEYEFNQEMSRNIEETCNSIPSTLSIEIAYAKVGNALKPQNKILKVVFRFIKNDVKLRCLNKNCVDRIKISTWVTFVDVSLNYKLEQAKIFKSKNVIKPDFFAPLLSSSEKMTNFNFFFLSVLYFYKFLF